MNDDDGRRSTATTTTATTWHHGLIARWWANFNLDGPEIAFFRTYVASGQPALDVECGSGRLLVPWSVERVDARSCRRRRMGGFAMHRDDQRLVGQVGNDLNIDGLGVDHHHRIGVRERPAFQQQQFPPAAFFGRCAEDGDPAAESVRKRCERDAGTDAGGADDVVAASVADAGQRVVLAADDDVRPCRSAAADERGGKIECRRVDLNTVPSERLRQLTGGEVFLVAQLGPGMDRVAEVREVLSDAVDGGCGRLLRLGPVGCVHSSVA